MHSKLQEENHGPHYEYHQHHHRASQQRRIPRTPHSTENTLPLLDITAESPAPRCSRKHRLDAMNTKHVSPLPISMSQGFLPLRLEFSQTHYREQSQFVEEIRSTSTSEVVSIRNQRSRRWLWRSYTTRIPIRHVITGSLIHSDAPIVWKVAVLREIVPLRQPSREGCPTRDPEDQRPQVVFHMTGFAAVRKPLQ